MAEGVFPHIPYQPGLWLSYQERAGWQTRNESCLFFTDGRVVEFGGSESKLTESDYSHLSRLVRENLHLFNGQSFIEAEQSPDDQLLFAMTHYRGSGIRFRGTVVGEEGADLPSGLRELKDFLEESCSAAD